MQKGVFTTWIKELCALVFVQTIQAFILAIVISIIITFIAPNVDDQKIAKLSDSDSIAALGVLCIVLLTSLTKMEQITKKIFGLESGVLQNKPPHGLMASFMALKAVGRVFNNIPKMIGGIGSATFGASLDKKKANSAMLTRLQRKGLDRNGNPLSGARQNAGGDSGSQSGGSDSVEDREYYNKAMEAKKRGDMAGYHRNMGIQAGINKARKSLAQGGGTSSSSGGTSSSDKARDDYYKIMDKYDDEIAKAKEKRREGIKNIASGVFETLGAAAGGMVGLSIGSVSGLATGDLDQMYKATAYGIGVGDALGENLTNAVASATTSIKSRASVNKKLDNQIAQMEKNLKIQNNTRENQAKRVRNITQKIEKNNGISNI